MTTETKLTWRRASKNNGFYAKGPDGEFHVYRAEKGRRAHEATLNGEVIGKWNDAADAMADIERSLRVEAE
jgi:hypothetical protein